MSPTAPNEHPNRFPTWNDDDATCSYPDCDLPRKKGHKFCARHQEMADEANRRQNEQDAAAGWSALESTDA